MEHVYYWKTPPTHLVEVRRDQSVKRVSNNEELCGVVQGFSAVSLLARHWVFPKHKKKHILQPQIKIM